MYSLCVSDVYAGEKPSEHQDATIGSTENGILPEWLLDDQDVFNVKRVGVLPPHNRYDHAIKLEGGEPPYGPLYNLSVTEL